MSWCYSSDGLRIKGIKCDTCGKFISYYFWFDGSNNLRLHTDITALHTGGLDWAHECFKCAEIEKEIK